MIISLDTETTGVDFVHGAAPFLVTTCDGDGVIRFWEWPVDPLTRRPEVPDGDLLEVTELIAAADLVYLHNSKFDWRALAAVGVDLPWEKVRDTMIARHLLGSNLKKNLTDCVADYLSVDIEPLELRAKVVVQACRKLAKKDCPDWLLAEEGAPGMPSVRDSSDRDEDKPWKNDLWLPRCMALNYDDYDPEWLTVTAAYANADSEYTLPLGLVMERLIREQQLWKIYEHRLRLMRADCEMECRGVTAIGDYTDATIADYEQYTAEAESSLKEVAAEYGHELELAAGASVNDNMRDFIYGAVWQECPRCGMTKRVKHWAGEGPNSVGYHEFCPKCAGRKRAPVQVKLLTHRRENLGLPVISVQHGGGKKAVAAALDKGAMQEYLHTTEGGAQEFIQLLLDKRRKETDLGYMRQYRRFWVPVPGATGYYSVHPFINPCGTDHLRQASNSPNMQNVSVQEEECEECEGGGCALCSGTGKSRLSVRACFGPAPGREWWDFDFRNLEKRVPVYECGEESLIEVFEQPDKPPYWGSDHNVLASLLFPDEYWPLAEVKDWFKKKHLIKYKRVKNTNFAKQYGAGKRKVDATAGVHDAYEKIERGLPKIAKLQAHYLALARRDGFVQTLPNRTVDPDRGYPILAGRMDDGRVMPTTPFNYHVSGTACDVKNAALVRCSDQCRRWRAEGFDAWVILEVHDSILFDFPRGATPEENKPRALVLRRLMEQSGDDLIPRIPTPVSMEWVGRAWNEGVAV